MSIIRNSDTGNYDLEVGIPATWVYKGTPEISCEVIHSADNGKIIMISQINDNLIIDDLVKYVGTIISTNGKIAEKEREFADRIQKIKDNIEDEANVYKKELEALKEKSFEILSSSTIKVNRVLDELDIPEASEVPSIIPTPARKKRKKIIDTNDDDE